MWTPTTRQQHSRAGLRYASDLTDAEWRLLEPWLPRPRRQGRRWAWPQREIINAIFYVMRQHAPGAARAQGFPPWRTVYRWFARLRDGGVRVRPSGSLNAAGPWGAAMAVSIPSWITDIRLRAQPG